MMPVWFESLGAWIWDASWHAAVVVAVVLLVRRLAGIRLPAALRCGLWALVAIRLLLVWTPEGSWSLFGFLEELRPVKQAAVKPDAARPTAAEVVDPRITVSYGRAPQLGTVQTSLVSEGAAKPAAFRTTDAMLLLWAVGAAVILLRTVMGWRRLQRRLACAAAGDAGLVLLLNSCRSEMGIARAVEVLVTDAVRGPSLTGIFRPKILLPVGLRERLASDELRFVFLHELAHLRRQDVLVEWGLAILTALHWFNPAVWAAAYFYRADREEARDEMVLRVAGDAQRSRYGHTLLRMLERLSQGKGAANLAIGMLSGKQRLEKRIKMIAGLGGTPARLTVLVLIVGLGVVGLMVLTNPKRATDVDRSTDVDHPGAKHTSELAEGTLPGLMETRVYDVADLLREIPDFDSDKEHPIGTGGAATQPTVPTPDQRVAALMKVVRETVDPESWKRSKADLMAESNGQLVIQQTAENHRQIVKVLDQLRETRLMQITTTVRFVVCNPGDLPADESILKYLQRLNQKAQAVGTTRPAGEGLMCLTASQTGLLLSAIQVQKSKGANIYSAPRVTTFNGQRAFVLIQTQHAYVSDLKIIRDENGKTKSYEPVIEVATSGLTLDLQATASADRKYVTLSIRPKLAKLVRLHTVPFLKIPVDHPAGLARPTVQVPEMLTTEVNTTAKIPDGETVVLDVGADAGQLSPSEADYKPQPGNRIYILVTSKMTAAEKRPGATTHPLMH